MEIALDLTGQVFGFLRVVGKRTEGGGNTEWECRCRCGESTTKLQWALLKGTGHRSCGCRAVEYRTWNSMKYRCSPHDRANYYTYYGRGIRVCQRWLDSFDAFYEDMGPRPGPEYSIDREDCDGDYEKSNCRWALPEVQQANRRKPCQRGFFVPTAREYARLMELKAKREQNDLSKLPAERAFV
jgi:hypothetical protein